MPRNPQPLGPTAPPASEYAGLDESKSEHIYLADEVGAEAATEPKTVVEKIELRDRLRGVVTRITLYDEGFLRLDEARRGKGTRSHRVDLRYLDPVPVQRRYYPKPLLKVAAICAGVAGLAALLALFPAVRHFALPVAFVVAGASFATFLLFVYLSHEKIVFRTMHGRAAALTLSAGLGCVRRLRAVLPTVIRSIGDAEEAIGEDTTIFLRAEMREHYRLRGDGILSEQECSDSTGRILVHFDDDM
jgi:hypothetical protein